MKIASLFDLITDASDVLDFFERVDTPEQLVSRLERLKRQGAEELLNCVDGLRSSIAAILQDTLEMSATVDEPDDDLDLDEELVKLMEEKQNPEPDPLAEKIKKDVPPES